MTRWTRRALPWVPTLLLLVIAVAHAVLVHRYDLSRWLGGGFGMFSTTDSSSSRHVHAFTMADDGARTEIELPAELDELVRHTRVLPTPSAVDRLSAVIARLPGAAGRPVHVEVWQTTYDTVTMAPSSRLLRAGTTKAVPSATR
jgi:hypothetical protein